MELKQGSPGVAHRVAGISAAVLLAMGVAGCGSSSPPFSSARAVSEAHQLTADLAQNRDAAAEARFDGTMQSALPASQLKGLWTGLVAKDGSYRSVGKTESITVNGVRVVVVTVNFSQTAIGLEWAFSSSGLVSGLHIVAPVTGAT